MSRSRVHDDSTLSSWGEDHRRNRTGGQRPVRRAPPRRDVHRPSPRERVSHPIESGNGSPTQRKVGIVVVSIAAILFLAIFPFWLSAFMDDETVDPGESYIVDQFMDGSSSVLVNTTFLGNDVYFTIPGNAEVEKASVTLSGALPPQRMSYQAGRNPRDIDVGDIDGDLFPDVVVANYKDDTVMVMKNTGSTFVQHSVEQVGKGPIRVQLAHFNDDGYPDMVVLSEDSRDLRILVNDGIGGFRNSGDPFTFNTLPSDMAIIDFDNDGDLDTVATTTNDDNLTLFQNDGNGKFTFHSNITTQGNPTRLGVCDLDMDGRDDLVIANRRDIIDMNGGKHEIYNIEKEKYYSWLSTLSFWVNNGNGEFERNIDDLRVQKGVSSIDCGDLNGDNYPDIVMANLGYHNVTIAETDGKGGYHTRTPSQLDVKELGSMDPIMARVRDMDMDGDLDIVGLTKSADLVLVYTGDGNGNFLPYVQNYVGLNPTAFQFIDHDSDGDMDIVTSDWKGWIERNGENGTISILTNLRSGIFRTYTQYTTGNSPRGVFVKDVDGDNDLEIATANYFGSTVSILKNDGLGFFSIPREYPIGLEPYAVVMEDFDGDGRMDGASADEANFRIVLLESNGEGGFSTDRFLYDIGAYPFSLRTGDIDSDGDMDLYTSNYFQNSTTLMFNDGSGNFNTMFNNYKTIYLGSNMPYDSIIEDLDGDGVKDLITVNRGDTLDPTDTISVMMNDGSYSFDDMVTYSVGKEPTSAVMHDMDKDGDMDIATANTGADSVTLMLNDGLGHFTKLGEYPAGDRPQFINIIDMDQDGWMDFLVTNTDTNNLVYIKSIGGYDYELFEDQNIASYPFAIDTGDLDKDGRDDIVISGVNTNVVIVQGCYWYPVDVTLDIGADGTMDHTIQGLVNEDGTIELDITSAVRDHLKEIDHDRDVRVPIRVIAGMEGVVVLKDLIVVYR